MPIEDANSFGHLTLSHFGTCMYSNFEINLSWTGLDSGLLISNIPRYFYFIFNMTLLYLSKINMNQTSWIFSLSLTPKGYCITLAKSYGILFSVSPLSKLYTASVLMFWYCMVIYLSLSPRACSCRNPIACIISCKTVDSCNISNKEKSKRSDPVNDKSPYTLRKLQKANG